MHCSVFDSTATLQYFAYDCGLEVLIRTNEKKNSFVYLTTVFLFLYLFTHETSAVNSSETKNAAIYLCI